MLIKCADGLWRRMDECTQHQERDMIKPLPARKSWYGAFLMGIATEAFRLVDNSN